MKLILSGAAALALVACQQTAALQDKLFQQTGITVEQQNCALATYAVMEDDPVFNGLATQDKAMEIAKACEIDTGALPLVIAIID